MSKDKPDTLAFVVLLDRPKGASVSDLKAYILDAVATWDGQLRPPGGYDPEDPGDPLWGVGDSAKIFRPKTSAATAGAGRTKTCWGSVLCTLGAR